MVKKTTHQLRRVTTRTAGRQNRRQSQRNQSLRRRSRVDQRVSTYQARARGQLKRFRQGSILAVAATSFLLLLWDSVVSTAQETNSVRNEKSDPAASVEQATGTIRELLLAFYSFLPKLVIALVLLGIGWVVSRSLRWFVRRYLHASQRAASISALVQIVWALVILVTTLSVLVGDIRALIGSLGLVGLALSWALQTPIESFTGWLLNTFRSYYRVGDRIEVGEVFGDVYKIDILTTTVWENGGPGKPVAGAQPTGALITFPNSEVLRSNIVNFSRDFPYVWDEVTVTVANESELSYTRKVLEETSRQVIGEEMAAIAAHYKKLLEQAGLVNDVAEQPQAFLSYGDTWVNCTVRYLVAIRTRRRWASALIEAFSKELARPEHSPKIKTAYPRTEVFLQRP